VVGRAAIVVSTEPTKESAMNNTTSLVITDPDITHARVRNESAWRSSSVALYAGDIEEFLSHWVSTPRYAVAYPIEGVPQTVEGREAFLGLFGGFAAAASHIEVHDVQFHQTDDPDVAFVEERMVADLHDGTRYENLLVLRVTFEDGLIRDIYEYYGEVAHRALIQRLFGRA
jgi:ketosteroid isomerase-like protein